MNGIAKFMWPEMTNDKGEVVMKVDFVLDEHTSTNNCNTCLHCKKYIDVAGSIHHNKLLSNISIETRNKFKLGEPLTISSYYCHLNAPVKIHSNDWCSHWKSTQPIKEDL